MAQGAPTAGESIEASAEASAVDVDLSDEAGDESLDMEAAAWAAVTLSRADRCVANAGLPDPGCTPGALNPAVTQANIQSTICRDTANLWPEAADPRPGFHDKDQVENYLHQQVCSGAMSLRAAQHAIATNWLTLYRQIHP